MAESKSILHELYVFSEWKPEPEYLQKPDNILPENISSLWRWLKFFGAKKSLIDSVTAHKERQQKWHIALGDEGKVIAVLTDNILEIRTKRSEYATIAARTTVSRDGYAQWRKLVWSPDCSFIVVAYGNGVVSFFDLTASNLFNIPADCSRPGGLECTDNTHAVSDIIFRPLRVKDTKWNWEVLVVTYDGKLRGYLVSQTEGFKLHHSFLFPGGVAAAAYCEPHATLYVAGVPRAPHKDPSSPVSAGITAWRLLNDEPFYKLSVVSDELEAQLANERFSLYIPLVFSKNMNFIIRMATSLDHNRLVCIHCNGDVSVWRLPALRAERRFRLAEQPQHALHSPLAPERARDPALYAPADVNWWSSDEIIVSRFSGAVTVCGVKDMVNILSKKPEFFQGTPKLTCAYDGAFMALECETNVLPARKSRSDESMEVVNAEAELDDTMLEVTKELFKTVLYAITDMETFQPKPRKITVVSRIYRLLGVKSTTPTELFSRKIESGNYAEALTLAEAFELDSDLVYQQQWRKNPVSIDAIQNYLSKVSKKIWAVHQCVDRLPESLQAAKELLHFGLELTNEKILDEINKDLPEDEWKDPDSVTLEDLNAYTSELLRCRHVMLFYKERLRLYEAILRCEKSTYVKDEYHRLRSNSVVHSAMEIAKEGRIEALTCLWPLLRSLPLQLAVLDKLPETLYPMDYQHLLPTKDPVAWFENKSPIKIQPSEHENDWCKKEIFRSIWSSNWSEDSTPENETASMESDLAAWYEKRARDIEERSGLVSYSLALVSIATVSGGVEKLDNIIFHLLTLDTLVYDINVEGVTLAELEKMSNLEVCKLLMKMSTPATFVSDLKQYMIPFLKRYEIMTRRIDYCLTGLTEFLESISVDDLSNILLVLQSHKDFELDVRTHLELVEKCLFAHTGTEQLDMACDLLDTILKETDGSISSTSLLRRCTELQRLVAGSERLACRGVRVPPCELRTLNLDVPRAHKLLVRVARSLAQAAAGRPDPSGVARRGRSGQAPTASHTKEPRGATSAEKPLQHDWEELLQDLLELRITLFDCITREECYEIYVSALLTSGDASTIRFASDVLSTSSAPRAPDAGRIAYRRSVEIVSAAAKEYFNSASSLSDPALELAKCCLTLIIEENEEIQRELDLIAALPMLAAFGLSILPIQVRLCEDKMTLIEECLQADPGAYLASHKLLKLAHLLRIPGDHQMREGQVLMAVGERALRAGAAGGAAAAAAARRLAALRHAPAAELLARVARHAHAHASTPDRRALLAAALALAPPDQLHHMLTARLSLELESLQQLGVAAREDCKLEARWPSTDDEFADAITTPVIEKKDLIPPTQEKMPLLNYLLVSFQNKFTLSGSKAGSPETAERLVRCAEFYRSLYPAHAACAAHYGYDRFAVPDDLDASPAGQAVLRWFYVQNCLENEDACDMETEVVHKCAEEILYKDTPLSVACLLRSMQDYGQAAALMQAQHSDTAVSAALYATLIRCNSPELRDNVYLAQPRQMAYMTLGRSNASDEQMAIIRQCVEKLCAISEVHRIRELGLNVNSLFFNADADYRTEIIYRLAESGGIEAVQLACGMASKYGLDCIDVWLHYALETEARIEPDTLPPAARNAEGVARIRDAMWPAVRGSEHATLIDLFTILKNIDDKAQLCGLALPDHIKLLKKVKAASPDLDYKLLVEEPAPEEFLSHILCIMKPDNVGLLTKLLRTLPPAIKLPVPINALYTMWLTKYFFSEGSGDKKWMQAWRQCASYFNKLAKEELLKFVAATCFSTEALQKVPWGTRSLMIMQAVDYCQQEQENDFKFNKNEQTWAQIGQELTRWARFLENYHSSSVQAIIENSGLPKDHYWPELEKSRGDVHSALAALAQAVLRGSTRAPPLASLLQCLHVPLDTRQVFQHMLHCTVQCVEDMEIMIARVSQYHKEGVEFSEEFLEQTMSKAGEFGLPPHKQLGLLTLRRRISVHDGDDMLKIAQSSVDLFKTEWPDEEYAQNLTEEKLLSMAGRREVFYTFSTLCDSWRRRRALVEVLACWPLTLCEGRSLHCEYLRDLLISDGHQSVMLIKMLLRRPVLRDEDIQQIVQNASRASVVNTIWVLLLNRADNSEELIFKLIHSYKDVILQANIEEDFIKELLDQGMFLKLVRTPLYVPIVNYIMNVNMSLEEPASPYTVAWATAELVKANHVAEAGNLQLLSMGVPSTLRGFSQTVQFCKKYMK
ncbi:NBAS subunit of NRZ tethering complex [Bicyclus anynana]|uniref:NBAS subunit of NRZ tethering complex n=1 Tax=Bicyclus anynana TaxID=110368 RepID=A0ABM3LKL8_BICAN|nr:NBAS subunit of NRZ tethering complex [Bicyclus anynana]